MLKEIKTDIYHYFVDENNLTQGEYKYYSKNGQLHIHAFYQNDNLHGEYKKYYDNDQLWVHTSYQYGKLHGEYKVYYCDGDLREHSSFQNDMRHGEHKTFFNNGKLKQATFYYQGINLHVDPDTLSEKDKTYIMMSGRLPPKEPSC